MQPCNGVESHALECGITLELGGPEACSPGEKMMKMLRSGAF